MNLISTDMIKRDSNRPLIWFGGAKGEELRRTFSPIAEYKKEMKILKIERGYQFNSNGVFYGSQKKNYLSS